MRDSSTESSTCAPCFRPSTRLAHLVPLLIFLPALACGQKNQKLNIKLDQVGYPTDAPKVALVSVPARTFQVKRSGDNLEVFKGTLSAGATDSKLRGRGAGCGFLRSSNSRNVLPRSARRRP